MDAPSFVIRRAEPSDVRPAYAVLRRAWTAYLHRNAAADTPTTTEAEIDEAWQQEGSFVDHVWRTAAENWVAVDRDGAILGWALSTERDAVLQLTHCYVEPTAQRLGVGRQLLARVFPPGRHGRRLILATGDGPALALYLRSGIEHLGIAADLARAPEVVAVATDLDLERIVPDESAVRTLVELEHQVLGFRREADVAFLLDARPAWLARRDGRPVGVAFGADPQGMQTGPIAALDPADMPALLGQVETAAAEAGIGHVSFSVPLANRAAVQHLLGRRYRFEPLFVHLLADDPAIRLDRWVLTQPEFIL